MSRWYPVYGIWVGLIVSTLFFPFLEDGFVSWVLLLLFWVLTPMSLSLGQVSSRWGEEPVIYRWMWYAHPFIATAGTLSIYMSPGTAAGTLAVLWLLFTVGLALFGLYRWRRQDWSLLGEWALDAGWIYTVIGGVWLVYHRFGMEFIPYDDYTMLLTAIHYHYTTLIVLINVAMVHRVWRGDFPYPKLMNGFSLALIAGPPLVASGIAIRGVWELVSVAIYSFMLFVLALMVAACAFRFVAEKTARLLLYVSGVSITFTSLFTTIYAMSNAFSLQWLTVSHMVQYHGITNTFGFALASFVGWRLAKGTRGIAINRTEKEVNARGRKN
ncbi:YndJ-like protein [Salsuginibacillus halophilus]|uniref:YndJ-like protein n=1 Tax=Salsuginibacillus halophilus TaxID=517424 RepID=A0A2P8HXQ9_9BACI|nr:YndJ family transporter [Salsuginibacillus halophilus]PSL51000.1 YndJ-like protein [Salsuginibacillus halophilus]